MSTTWEQEKKRLGIEHLSDAETTPQLTAWVERAYPDNPDLFWLRRLCRDSDRPLSALLGGHR